MDTRIGFGYDSHEFKPGVPLRIGGMTLDHPEGLAGHSDGDVLLHAITDALLGAVAAGDIGSFFPPGDPRWKDADSAIFLNLALEELQHAGYRIVNVDTTLILAAPKISPIAGEMCARVADLLGVEIDQVSIKAKTPEGLNLDHVAQCHAVVLVERVQEPEELKSMSASSKASASLKTWLTTCSPPCTACPKSASSRRSTTPKTSRRFSKALLVTVSLKKFHCEFSRLAVLWQGISIPPWSVSYACIRIFPASTPSQSRICPASDDDDHSHYDGHLSGGGCRRHGAVLVHPKKAGFTPWLSLLYILPLLGTLVLLYVLAFADWKVVPVQQDGLAAAAAVSAAAALFATSLSRSTWDVARGKCDSIVNRKQSTRCPIRPPR